MVSVTIALSDFLKTMVKNLPWINWSEFARQESLKKIIFERYIKTKDLSDDDWKFCEEIDWHPVDELPMKKEFVKKLEAAKKERGIKYNSVSELFAKLK